MKKRILAAFLVLAALSPSAATANDFKPPKGPVDDAITFLYGVMTERCRQVPILCWDW